MEQPDAIVLRAITEQVNATVYPPDWNVLHIPVLKPFKWDDVPEDATAGQMPYWIARFRRPDAETPYVLERVVDAPK